MVCFWCDTETEQLTLDHIVPRSLGGTKEFTVSACVHCQSVISKAEHEVARKSPLAIPALVSGITARHPERPTSGHLRPVYLLVKHPLGGYGETLLSAGARMAALAHIELRLEPGEPFEGRVRGPSAEAAQRLIDTFRCALATKPTPDGFVCELATSLELDPATAADHDFWPRIVLLPNGRLLIRGRNPEELTRFVRAFTGIVANGYRVDPSAWKNGEEIKGGTPHLVALKSDPRSTRRIVAKIAYGLLRVRANKCIGSARDVELRGYILGRSVPGEEPVSVETPPTAFTTSEKAHSIVLSPPHDPNAAVVSLYGLRFRVELGPSAGLPQPIAFLCEIDGSGIRQASDAEANLLIEDIKSVVFSQPRGLPDSKNG